MVASRLTIKLPSLPHQPNAEDLEDLFMQIKNTSIKLICDNEQLLFSKPIMFLYVTLNYE